MKSILLKTASHVFFFIPSAFAHNIYVQKNPTNESGIVWGVNNANQFVRWRAYIRGLSNNSQGDNSGWKYANDWWYYDLNSINDKVMYRVNGLENQNFELTYWVFKSDGSWEFGEKVIVIHDQILPDSQILVPYQNQEFTTSPNFHIISSDNNLIEWTRLYLWVPNGYEPPGWTNSGTNQYYKEFIQEEFNYTLSGAIDGNYILTAWVKDKAGNINYEPWGRVNFTVKQGSIAPQPEPQPQPDPTPPQPEPQPQPDPTPPQPDPTPPQPEPQPDPTPPQTEPTPTPLVPSENLGFGYPVNTDYILRWENNINNGEWYDYQPFGALFNYSNKMHLGVDLNKAGGDKGKPVYAVNDCFIEDYSNTNAADGWGKWILLKCDAPSGYSYRLSNGKTVQTVYPFYAHIGKIEINTDTSILNLSDIVKGVTKVKKGNKIATVGNGNGYYDTAYHLHFEIKLSNNNVPGAGYQSVNNNELSDNVDPLEFIQNNKVLNQKEWHIFVHPYDMDTNNTVYMQLDTSIWRTQERQSINERRSLGYGDFLWLKTTDSDINASWHFTLPKVGWYELYIYLPHAYATAQDVKYSIWHSGENLPNPYNYHLNQNRNPNQNERFYLGRFKFNNNWDYSLDLSTKKNENNKTLIIDAIELVYVENDGYGGGLVSYVDRDQDFLDDTWEVAYGLNPDNPDDAQWDEDTDHLLAYQEYYFGTDPTNADTDGDTYIDGWEIGRGTDPLDPNDFPSIHAKDFENTGGGNYDESVSNTVDNTNTIDDTNYSNSTSDGVIEGDHIISKGGYGCSIGSNGNYIEFFCMFFLVAIFGKKVYKY